MLIRITISTSEWMFEIRKVGETRIEEGHSFSADIRTAHKTRSFDRNNQRFFVAAETSLPSIYVATIRRYANRSTDTTSNYSCIGWYIHCRGNMCTERLNSSEERVTLYGAAA